MPTPGPGIGRIRTEAQLEAFVRDRLRPELTKAMRQGVYLQLATAGGYKTDFGVAVVGTSGASPYSATVTVPHAIKRVPVAVVATANGLAGAWSVTGLDSSDFELQGYKTDGGNWPGNINTYWVAIG